MTAIHFAHANGFPAGCFSCLLDRLGVDDVTAVDKMGHGDYVADGDLWNLTDEMIAEIERRHDRPVVGLGHSTGGALLVLAAVKRPELFHDLILLDPMVLSALKRNVLRLFRLVGFGDYLGPTRLALRRNSHYPSLEAARSRLRDKRLFREFHPACLEAFFEHAFVETKEGAELAFSKDVEVAIFRSTQAEIPTAAFSLRGLMVYGSRSHLLQPIDVRWWRRRLTGFEILPFEGGHLFPLENPEEVARLVRRRLAAAIPR